MSGNPFGPTDMGCPTPSQAESWTWFSSGSWQACWEVILEVGGGVVREEPRLEREPGPSDGFWVLKHPASISPPCAVRRHLLGKHRNDQPSSKEGLRVWAEHAEGTLSHEPTTAHRQDIGWVCSNTDQVNNFMWMLLQTLGDTLYTVAIKAL